MASTSSPRRSSYRYSGIDRIVTAASDGGLQEAAEVAGFRQTLGCRRNDNEVAARDASPPNRPRTRSWHEINDNGRQTRGRLHRRGSCAAGLASGAHARGTAATCAPGVKTIAGASARTFCGPAKATVKLNGKTISYKDGTCSTSLGLSGDGRSTGLRPGRAGVTAAPHRRTKGSQSRQLPRKGPVAATSCAPARGRRPTHEAAAPHSSAVATRPFLPLSSRRDETGCCCW